MKFLRLRRKGSNTAHIVMREYTLPGGQKRLEFWCGKDFEVHEVVAPTTMTKLCKQCSVYVSNSRRVNS